MDFKKERGESIRHHNYPLGLILWAFPVIPKTRQGERTSGFKIHGAQAQSGVLKNEVYADDHIARITMDIVPE